MPSKKRLVARGSSISNPLDLLQYQLGLDTSTQTLRMNLSPSDATTSDIILSESSSLAVTVSSLTTFNDLQLTDQPTDANSVVRYKDVTLHNEIYFRFNDTYLPNPNVKYIEVTLVGAGGAGGYHIISAEPTNVWTNYDGGNGTGGGAGSFIKFVVPTELLSFPLPIIVGKGGSSTTNLTNDGGDTFFGPYAVARGGKSGFSNANSKFVTGGAGGFPEFNIYSLLPLTLGGGSVPVIAVKGADGEGITAYCGSAGGASLFSSSTSGQTSSGGGTSFDKVRCGSFGAGGAGQSLFIDYSTGVNNTEGNDGVCIIREYI